MISLLIQQEIFFLNIYGKIAPSKIQNEKIQSCRVYFSIIEKLLTVYKWLYLMTSWTRNPPISQTFRNGSLLAKTKCSLSVVLGDRRYSSSL